MNKTFIDIDFSKETFDAMILHKGNLNDKGIHEQFESNKTALTDLNVELNRSRTRRSGYNFIL